uniref:Alternative protein ALG8 n=1 Tax=Homo sapiens TaxID=9606 RepID=L8E8S9_HUMAN|nr:alternative protein ALG8 [Homo sapiens]
MYSLCMLSVSAVNALMEKKWVKNLQKSQNLFCRYYFCGTSGY